MVLQKENSQMVDYFLIGWIASLLAILFVFRKNVEIQFPIILLKSKSLGEKVYRISRGWKGWLAPLSDLGVLVGFAGMAFVVWFLGKTLVQTVITGAKGPAAVSIIIPGVRIPGSSIFLPFTYGIISIVLLAAVHEFSHAIVASSHGVKPKSIAFALLLFVPAAGVEIDEAKLAKHPLRTKLRIFAAGSFSNFLFAGLVLVLSFGLAFVAKPHVTPVGMEVVSTEPGSGAYGAIANGTIIVSIDGTDVRGFDDFVAFAKKITPGEVLRIESSDGRVYRVQATAQSANPDSGKIGITTKQKAEIDRFGKVLVWILGLLQWIFVLNIGVAIINLFPFPIMDGGRMIADVIKELWPKYSRNITIALFSLTAPLLALNILIPIVKALFFK